MEAALINQPADPPGWIVTCVSVAEFLGFKSPGKPGRLALLVLLYMVGNTWNAYALTLGLRAEGHTLLPINSLGCSIRAELAPLLVFLAQCIDFAVMAMIYVPGGMPSLWTVGSGKALADPHAVKVLQRSLPNQPAFIVFLIPWAIYLVCWLQPSGWGWGLAAMLGWVVILPPQWLLNAVTYDFAAIHLDIKQGEFIENLLSGRFDYTQAVQAYNHINSERKALKRVLSLSSSVQSVIMFASSAVFLYDYEFRPWSAWPLFMMFILQGLFLAAMFAQFVEANEFYEKLAAKVAESIDGDFLWPPADRTNFLALIANTKVSFTIVSFELSSGFYIAVASLLFGWFWILAEFKQFHGFQGLPFDMMCDNITDAGEGGGHGHE